MEHQPYVSAKCSLHWAFISPSQQNSTKQYNSQLTPPGFFFVFFFFSLTAMVLDLPSNFYCCLCPTGKICPFVFVTNVIKRIGNVNPGDGVSSNADISSSYHCIIGSVRQRCVHIHYGLPAYRWMRTHLPVALHRERH